MAAFCMHYLFASDLMPDVSKLVPGVTIERDAVFWGTQGPDVFFFHRALPTMPGKSLRSVGSRLHRASPAAIFTALWEFWDSSRHNRPPLASYLAGFLMHYALDRTLHPFVFAQQREWIAAHQARYLPSIVHNRIETNLDVILLREKGFPKGNAFPHVGTLAENEGWFLCWGEMYSHLVSKVLSETYTKETLQKVFSDTIRVQRSLYDPRGSKRRTAVLLEGILPGAPPALSTLIRTPEAQTDWDYANAEKRAWVHGDHPGENHRESVFELYDRALADARMLIHGFFSSPSGSSMEELTGGVLFDAGEHLSPS